VRTPLRACCAGWAALLLLLLCGCVPGRVLLLLLV
jgi:hypothetical protein